MVDFYPPLNSCNNTMYTTQVLIGIFNNASAKNILLDLMAIVKHGHPIDKNTNNKTQVTKQT